MATLNTSGVTDINGHAGRARLYRLRSRPSWARSGGLRVHFDSFDQPVDDLKRYFDTVKRRIPANAVRSWHSMGSFIATQFVLSYQDELAGFISSGSPLTIDTTIPAIMATIGKIQSYHAQLAPD
jgi:alpha-beta hydrolase superfamily lysophospholipase